MAVSARAYTGNAIWKKKDGIEEIKARSLFLQHVCRCLARTTNNVHPFQQRNEICRVLFPVKKLFQSFKAFLLAKIV